MNKKIFILMLFIMFYVQLNALRRRVGIQDDLKAIILVDHQAMEEERFANLGGINVMLFAAVINGWHCVVRMILRIDQTRVFVKDNFENTPLHYAALLGDDVTTRILVDYGAALWAKNCYDKTPKALAESSYAEVKAAGRDAGSFVRVLDHLRLMIKVK